MVELRVGYNALTATEQESPSLEHLATIHTEMHRALDLQLSRLDDLDRKATSLLTPIGVLLGLGVTTGHSVSHSLWASGIFHIGLAVLVATLLIGLWVLWPRPTAVVPKATGLWPRYIATDTGEMLGTECSSIALAYAQNADLSTEKRVWLTREYLGLVADAILLTLGYGVDTAGILG